MEEYQFGKHLSLDKILENKKYYAKLFAEGNNDLEKILMYCFNHGIETYMCCAGHFEDAYEYELPFIMLNIPYTNKEIIYSIVSSVYDNEEAIIRLGKKYERDIIEVDLRAYSSTSLFNSTYNGITDLSNAKKVKPEIINIVEVLDKFNHPPYDIYFQSSYFDGRTHFETWVDYVYAIDERRSRFLHVLYDRVPSTYIEQRFSESNLNAHVKKIKAEKNN